MAKIGLKYMKVAKLAETSTSLTYSEAMILGRAIQSDVTPNINEAELYADDVLAEKVSELSSLGLSIQTAELDHEQEAFILGKAYNSQTKEIETKSNDNAPYVGLGFYANVMRNNVVKYRAFWFYKVKFAEPTMNVQSKGSSLAFQTPTTTGTAIPLESNGAIKVETICDTQEAAKAWIDQKSGATINIMSAGGTVAAMAQISIEGSGKEKK